MRAGQGKTSLPFRRCSGRAADRQVGVNAFVSFGSRFEIGGACNHGEDKPVRAERYPSRLPGRDARSRLPDGFPNESGATIGGGLTGIYGPDQNAPYYTAKISLFEQANLQIVTSQGPYYRRCTTAGRALLGRDRTGRGMRKSGSARRGAALGNARRQKSLRRRSKNPQLSGEICLPGMPIYIGGLFFRVRVVPALRPRRYRC